MSDPTVSELLGQGLMITVLGMGLVFLGLSLLWGLMAALTRLFRDRPEVAKVEAPPVAAPAEVDAVEALTAERSAVAAAVAGAILAGAMPARSRIPVLPPNGHHADEPWTSTHRSRALQPWHM